MTWWIWTAILLHVGTYTSTGESVCDLHLDFEGDGVEEGSIRLVDGPNPYSGRVEVHHYGSWGSVSADFSINDGRVMCRQLGMKFAAIHKGRFYKPGPPPVGVPGQFSCVGDEERITECPDYFPTWKFEVFDLNLHKEDKDGGLECLPLDPPEGYVQLLYGIGGAGRVITYVNGEWNFICTSTNTWKQDEAYVIGRQLGLSTAIKPLHGLYKDKHSNVSLTETTLLVDCIGQEESISDCSTTAGVDVATCGEDNLAAVQEWTAGVDGIEARLVYGTGPFDGLVEVYYDNRWGRVCYNDDYEEARLDAFISVLCGQLGFERFGKVSIGKTDSGNGGIFSISHDLLRSPNCTGSEGNIGECPGYAWGIEYCGDRDFLVVSCRATTDQGIHIGGGCQLGPIGTPHIFFNNTWGRICKDHWTANESTVACRQAGLSTGYSVSFPDVEYDGRDPFRFTDSAKFNVQCPSDTVDTLNDCSVQSLSTCDMHVASVGCFAQRPELRLIGSGSNTPYSGFVQIKFDSMDWTWFDFDQYDDKSSIDMLCRQLGFIGARHSFTKVTDYHLMRNLLPLMDMYPISLYIECMNDAQQITDCYFSKYRDRKAIDYTTSIYGLNCDGSNGPVDEYHVTFYSGLMVDSGVIEVSASDHWGTVCSDGWNEAAARVVCRQLGLGTNVVKAYNIQPYRYYASTNFLSFMGGYMNVMSSDVRFSWLMGLNCTGSEENIGNCPKQGWGNVTQCSTMNLAGVICSNEEPTYKLAKGDESSGILQITVNGITGTVNSEGLTTVEFDNSQDDVANIACKKMGFSSGLAHATIWMDLNKSPLLETFPFLERLNCNLTSLNSDDILGCWHEPLMHNYGNLKHEEDLNIECFKEEIDGNIQLIGGTGQTGRVSVFLNGAWGNICGDTWTKTEAKVVCEQLGLPTTYVKAIVESNPSFRKQNHFAIHTTECTGQETELNACTVEPYRSSEHNCNTHGAGVQCFANKPEYRLTKGPPYELANGDIISVEGLVEIKIDGYDWSPVCGNSFNEKSGELLCEQISPGLELDVVKGKCYAVSDHMFKVYCSDDAISLDDCVEDFGFRHCDYQAYVRCSEPLHVILDRAGLTIFDVSEQPSSLYWEIAKLFRQKISLKPPFSTGMVLTKVAVDLNQTLESFSVTVRGTGMICYALSTVKKSMIRTVYGDPADRTDMFNGKFKNCAPVGSQDPTTPATTCTYTCTCTPACDHYQLDISNKFQFPTSEFSISSVTVTHS